MICTNISFSQQNNGNQGLGLNLLNITKHNRIVTKRKITITTITITISITTHFRLLDNLIVPQGHGDCNGDYDGDCGGGGDCGGDVLI